MDLALAALAGLAVSWVPGAVATRLLRIGSADRIVRVAQEIALGLSFWPVLLLYFSWSAVAARIFFGALVIALLFLIRRPRRPDRVEITALAVFALVAVTRVEHIRGVALPLWVDSVHHTMIVRLLVEHGTVPRTYAPFIPDGAFYYHWGFHAFAAFAAWTSGLTAPDEIPRLLLGMGQLLNALTFFAVYCGAHALWRTRRAALVAATLATLVSIFPAYYVSWGRSTQLCGLLILPPLARAFWRLGRHPSRRGAVEVAWLGAGLVLIHVRVAIVFAILAAVILLVLRRRNLVWCAAAALAALLIAAPWLVRLAVTPQVRMILAPASAEWQTSNAAPRGLLLAPHNALLFALAALGVIARRRGRARAAVVLAWVAVTALLINLDRAGLPRLRALPNSAAIAMLFLPASILAARRMPLAVTLAIAIGGAATMRHVVNPVTVLATDADRRALDWIRASTRPDARFAVGVQPWIGGAFVGVDGGYWIALVADRASILPPGLYPWVVPRARVAQMTRILAEWHDASQRADLEIVERLRREGVTHLYFGARNEEPIRQSIAASPLLRRVYTRDGVEIFAMR